MWLSWRWGLVIALVVSALTGWLRRSGRRPGLQSLTNELSLMFFLYTLWRIAGELSLIGLQHALQRGKTVWDIERTLRLPNELTIQRWVLPYRWVIQSSNFYYAVAHAAGLGIFLVWLFFRHRDRYPLIRTTLALGTFFCLIVELMPVSPPRLTPGLGFVDTANLYGQSVYGASPTGGSFDQLSAMPSVHVAWAVLIGWYVWRVSPSKWRWIAVAHAVLTVFVVTVTANHWLLDGIVATGLVVAGRAVAGRISGRFLRTVVPPAAQAGVLIDVNGRHDA